MPKVRGTLVAYREREIENSRRGTSFKAKQLAYIPHTDPDGFPAVLNCDDGTFAALDKVTAGELIELTFIETPPYGDKLVVNVAPMGVPAN